MTETQRNQTGSDNSMEQTGTIRRRKPIFQNRIGELIASVILGFLEILALSLYYRDSLGFWTDRFVNVLLFLGLWIVACAVIFLFFLLIGLLIRPERILTGEKEFEPDRKGSLIDRRPFLVSVIVLVIFYLPWIIIFYPGSAIYDMMFQTIQADGLIAINAHHPIFVTYIIGLCSKLGLLLTGKLNLGIFFYILLQTAVCILSFSYMISYMTKLGAAKGFRIATLVFFAVVPLWGGAMQCGTKDTLFTGLFVLFIVQSIKLLSGKEPFFRTGQWIGYGVLLLLLCLYRNGIFVILVPTLIVFFFALEKGKKLKGKFVLFCIVALALGAVFNTVTKNVYHTKTETGEILSLPFQQTARYVRDHGEELTKEEKEIVETTFGLENVEELGTLYYPMSSDPVKARYHWWASDREKDVLKDYFRSWGQMLKKHPGTFLEAALSQTYGYYTITPVIKNQKGGAGTTVQFFPDTLAVSNAIASSEDSFPEGFVPESPASLEGARELLSGWYFLWLKLPVTGLFFKCGFYFLILLAVTLYYGKRKNKIALISIPAFLLILMAIASPVNEHIRYILPVCAALPVLIAGCAAKEGTANDR